VTPQAQLDLVLERGRITATARVQRLRGRAWQVGQCAVAAGVAWFIAADLLGHDTPFFAPIAAVVSLGTSYGQRLRRVAEVTLGVAIGVFIGDMFTHLLGSGAWQLMLIVGLAMSLALLLDTGIVFVNQAAVQAIVVSTLLPDPGAAFTRWTDALIGGGVALVAATVVPRAPLRRPHQQAAVVVDKVTELLRAASDSIEDGELEHALEVLKDARSTDPLMRELQQAADEGLSVLASSPFRRRHRAPVRRMVELVEPLDRALRNTRVLVRRVAIACYRREELPAGYAAMVRDLADATAEVSGHLATGRHPDQVQDLLVRLGRATSAAPRSTGLSGQVVLAQVRSIIADLLAVCGMDPLEATDAVPPLES
jgi:uncharacterized membrane protein YgaE (UPF0421/DUF939 family)